MQTAYQGNPTYVTSARPQNDGWKPPPVFMLVMGLSGCGKSSFINLMTGQADCSISTGPKLCTKFPRSCRVSRWMGNCEFRFIDTPGFANDTIDDRLVLERLVEYLAPQANRYDGSVGLPRRIAGLLYIHSEDEPFKGRTSRKTIEMLVRILGERFLDRVTVLIRSQDGVPIDFAKVALPEDSPLYPLYCNNIKPWATIPYTQDLRPVEHVLQSYIGLSPRLVWLAAVETFVQRYGNNRNNDIPRHLRELFPDDVGPLIISNQADIEMRLSGRVDELEKELAQKEEEIKVLKSTHEIELKDIQDKSLDEKADHDIQRGSLCNRIRDQEAEITELQSRNSSGLQESEALKQLNSKKDSEILVLQGELAAKNEEMMKVKEDNDRAIQELKEKLRDKESEVVELKSRTNGTSNGTTTKTTKKQGDEVHHLKAEIQRISAEYGSLRTHMQLQENTEQADIMKALGDINRLVEEFGQTISEHIEMHTEQNPSKKPLQPKDLLSIFGQVEGDLASKIKQDAYLLLEYAVQAVMCDQLYTHLFKPFHPSISDDRNVFVAQIHAELARQAPQSVSGRWRKDAFNSISRCLALGGQDKSDSERMHRLLTGALVPLLGKFDGIKPEDVLKKHDKALVKLVTKAEELNQLIKGGVSVLGDFQPVAFPFGRAFQSSHMSEVTSKPKKPRHVHSSVSAPYNHTALRNLAFYMSGIHAPGGAASKSFEDPWDGPSKIVIGIDIGSTQSGVAYAFLQQGAKQSIHRVTQWPGQESQNLHGKIPTVLWYDSTKKAVSFGAEALTPQAEEEAEDNGWKLARYFKLHLHPPHLTAQHGLDVEPLPFSVPLSQIYSDFLGYLLQHTQSYFEDHIIDGKRIWQQYKATMEVVLAHPNGWGIREQAFLRLASVKAGFTTANDAATRVHFVNEAEASVHFCALYSDIGTQLKPGTTFAVCDAGGSTVDTTVYSVKSLNPIRLEETRASDCVQAGALFIDKAAEKYLRKILHEAELSEEDIEEYATRGVKDFELHSKRAFKDVATDQSIEIAGTRYNNTTIRARRGRITLQGSEVKTLFDFCAEKILDSVNSQLQGGSVSHILLVGGFGESPHLRERIKERFGPMGCDVTTTSERTSKAVADGTIIWYSSNNVVKRTPWHSYGIEILVPYDPRTKTHKGRKVIQWPTGAFVKGGWSQIVPGGIPVDCDSVSRRPYYREYTTPNPQLSNFAEDIWYYTLKGVPQWMRFKPVSMLSERKSKPLERSVASPYVTKWYSLLELKL
ncbi:unnamed protein product [Rhizoctonia solani]|uniref:G domain-containing protein n=1 Tax=Rhizoctonia solani TaxID=456999 RepID=A0A8H2Y535_9AGAM|nr:unnamed protein product [Rhizoctonia solani]